MTQRAEEARAAVDRGVPASAARSHTVEKIGGTSMSRARELLDTILIGTREGEALYNRVFVVSAFGGITDKLLEHKKSGKAGVYAQFAHADNEHGWMDALSEVSRAMREINAGMFDHAGDRQTADDFVRERIEGARGCLIDLQRLCSYGHFQLVEHMQTIREMLSALGEAHSANNLALLLRRHGVNARLVDLTGWRDEAQPDLDERIETAFAEVDLARELPIVTGYAQCREGLMREFDRGYSEVTFATIAALTGAREAIIHKEFHLSSADPRLVGAENVRKIGRTNYDVADQLSNMGMEAIHPKAAKKLRQAGVPLRVANAFEPHDPGTLIDAEPADRPGVEMVTGLPVTTLELFEQDMVGVKGYDAAILDVLTRHRARIVSKVSNANSIVHHIEAPLKTVRRIERDLTERHPLARITTRRAGMVSVIGRDLKGLNVMLKGLTALYEAGIEPISAQETGRGVDVQFMVVSEDREQAVKTLHHAFVEAEESPRLAKAA
ncbi:aspartate kinase [Chelativorans salis]|uniref:aspartate kinase n=1 Tax=Chelativorans salis TaxID=2978478 RepID=A0ABT2LS45_9HYPH|nr:aspartate kinase [Chelativorans sp. EGI FJ00035]MCT7377346.1 aspartate kinase [Chelativorans sp. EGI FJ00035]